MSPNLRDQIVHFVQDAWDIYLGQSEVIDSLRAWRQQDGINDVNHAVRARDIRLDDLRAIDHDVSVFDRDFCRLALDCLDILAVELDDIGGQGLTRDDVILEDRGQLFLVFWFEQALNRTFGKFGERRIGRGEDRERAVTLQCLDQAGGLDRGDQRLETPGTDGGVDNVFPFTGKNRYCQRDECEKPDEISRMLLLPVMMVVDMDVLLERFEFPGRKHDRQLLLAL